MSKLILGIALTFIISFSMVNAEPTIAPKPQNAPMSIKTQIDEIITRKAFVYGVDEQVMSKIIMCESSNNPKARNVSSVEDSRGLVQINTLVHDVSIEEAESPEYAIDFLAKNLKNGKAERMWITCFRLATRGV